MSALSKRLAPATTPFARTRARMLDHDISAPDIAVGVEMTLAEICADVGEDWPPLRRMMDAHLRGLCESYRALIYAVPDLAAALGDPAVVGPAHYVQSRGTQTWDYIVAAGLGRAAARANVIKYAQRHSRKGGVIDLAKAGWYLDRLARDYGVDPDGLYTGEAKAAKGGTQ